VRLIERYVLKRLFVAFFATLVGLAGVVWVTQALRELNLVTAKGQTILVFLEVSVLALPLLLVVIAPFAVLVATIVTLNSLNASSELVVVNASGGSRFLVLRPILILAGAVSLGVLFMTTLLAPSAQRQLRAEITKVNVDLIANIVRPGRFTEIEEGLTFHIRNRAGDGSLAGLMIDDARDPVIAYTYFADKAVVLETGNRTLLVMRDGVMQRLTRRDATLSLVNFEAYAFDLSELQPQNTSLVFRPSERTIEELLLPDMSDAYVQKNFGRFRSELHDRLSQPFLPLAFAVLAFLFLGDARTTRQGGGLAIIGAATTASMLRGAHFGSVSASTTSAFGVALVYAVPLLLVTIGLLAVAFDRKLGLPPPIERAFEVISEAAQSIAAKGLDRVGPRRHWGSR
jgi:lipopolysaccharide export system permease protein